MLDGSILHVKNVAQVNCMLGYKENTFENGVKLQFFKLTWLKPKHGCIFQDLFILYLSH